MSLTLRRKSIRKFVDSKVSDDAIEKLLMSGMQAPSATNQQPWEFIVIKNREILEKLSEVSQGAWPLKDAPLGILTLMKEDVKRPEMAPQDMAASTQNILLQATDLGLGAVWIGVYPREERMQTIQKLLDIKPALFPFSLIALGYPESQNEHVKYRFDSKRIKVIE